MTREELDRLIEAARKIPGAVEIVGGAVQDLKALHDGYRRTHWGNEGTRGAVVSSVPNTDQGVIEMGALVAVEYRTTKGGNPQQVFRHLFRPPLPILAYAADGSGLVVVRDRSRYTITARGIEG